LELGANDALQGGDLGELRKNLEAAIREAQSAGVFVLLVGMRAPPNLGKRYCEEFDRIYPDLARRLKVPLVPFVLEGVAGIAALNQGDMRHPNPQGQLRVAENILKHWEPYL
jgi:acyl-CoA thioesterase-1